MDGLLILMGLFLIMQMAIIYLLFILDRNIELINEKIEEIKKQLDSIESGYVRGVNIKLNKPDYFKIKTEDNGI